MSDTNTEYRMYKLFSEFKFGEGQQTREAVSQLVVLPHEIFQIEEYRDNKKFNEQGRKIEENRYSKHYFPVSETKKLIKQTPANENSGKNSNVVVKNTSTNLTNSSNTTTRNTPKQQTDERPKEKTKRNSFLTKLLVFGTIGVFVYFISISGNNKINDKNPLEKNETQVDLKKMDKLPTNTNKKRVLGKEAHSTKKARVLEKETHSTKKANLPDNTEKEPKSNNAQEIKEKVLSLRGL